MTDREEVIRQVFEAFHANPYPGDPYLQGSFEGCEPYDEVGFFKGVTDWTTLKAEVLDAHCDALSFFSEAGFRFFLPAYLIADLKDELRTADPLFHLSGGFSTVSVKIPVQAQRFVRKHGGGVLLNPQRYGAISFADYARYRLSVFTKDEAGAIVSYLRYVRDRDGDRIHWNQIDAALNTFWLERARNAPSKEDLKRQRQEEKEFIAAMNPASNNSH